MKTASSPDAEKMVMEKKLGSLVTQNDIPQRELKEGKENSLERIQMLR